MTKFALLLTLLLSCTTNSTSTTPKPLTLCVVPTAPVKPKLDPQACGDKVCLTVEETKALAKYAHDVAEVERAIDACNLVVRK